MKIIVTERIADEGINYLRESGFEVDVKYGISHGDLLGIIQGLRCHNSPKCNKGRQGLD